MHFMLIFFVGLSRSEWWDFDPNAFDKRIQNSAKVPIYAVAFHSLCHFCHGIHERFHAFSESVVLPRPVSFTAINCTEYTSNCKQLGFSGYPSFLYIPKPERHYWERPGYQDPADWKSFILGKLKSHLIDVSSASDDEHSRMEKKNTQRWNSFSDGYF
jgi:hypothetical protein